MIKKSAIRSVFWTFSAVLLAGLLLVSPCKVRNAIQSTLDLEQTQVASKSRATLNGHTCTLHESIDAVANTVRPGMDIPVPPGNHPSDRSIIPAVTSELPALPVSRTSVAPLVPFYILYRRLKVYL